MYDLIIVGGGPAGLTAAIYAIHKRLNVLLLSQDLGGKINYNLELPEMNTPPVIRGAEVVEQFWQELEGVNFHLERITAVQKHNDVFTLQTVTNIRLQAKSVLWAAGSRIRLLEVPGEQEFMGKGLSYSAVSHAPLFVGKKTAVIGNAKLALSSVAELALVANIVHFIVPIPTHTVIESSLLKRLVASGKVVVWKGYKVRAITGERYANCVVLEAHDGRQLHISTDGIFIELGQDANSEAISGLAKLDDDGFVIVDNLNRTTCPGLFAAGDVTNAYTEQVLISIGEGAKAALSAYEYLLPLL